jgi:hypothetical protein
MGNQRGTMIQYIATIHGVEIDEETYDNMLGAVPPVKLSRGSFLVGEIVKYDHDGRGLYSCFTMFDGKYYAVKLCTKDAFDDNNVDATPERIRAFNLRNNL